MSRHNMKKGETLAIVLVVIVIASIVCMSIIYMVGYTTRKNNAEVTDEQRIVIYENEIYNLCNYLVVESNDTTSVNDQINNLKDYATTNYGENYNLKITYDDELLAIVICKKNDNDGFCVSARLNFETDTSIINSYEVVKRGKMVWMS